jgi:hypothetical protein
MWDLWGTKWRWGRFSSSTSVSPANVHSTICSTITIICHPGLVKQASSGRSTKWTQTHTAILNLRTVCLCELRWVGNGLEDEGIGVWFPDRRKRFFSFPQLWCSQDCPAFHPNGYRGSILEGKAGNAEITNAWSSTFSLPYAFMAQCLIKRRETILLLPCTKRYLPA